MGSHSTRKEERRTRRRLRKERKRTLRREQKERHRLKRAEKAARKEARRLRREARTAYDAPVDPELDELRRLRYLRATGTPTPVELYEARAWRDGSLRPPAHYAPPTPAELAELRRLRYLREGEATEVELAQARDFAARASGQSRSSVPPRQSAKKSLGWGASVHSPRSTAKKETRAVIQGDIGAFLAARDKDMKGKLQKKGLPINPPELVYTHNGKLINAKIARGRNNGGKLEFELQPLDGHAFWIDAVALQEFAKDTPLASWCADRVAQNCAAASYPTR